MPKYVISSDSPITAQEITKPDFPDWGGELPGGRPTPPIVLPPLPPEISLPIPPSPEFPMVPLPPDVDPPSIWPPVRPEFPDFGGKTLALALIFISGHAARYHWIVIDHEEAKEKWEAIKGKLPHPEHPIAPGQPPREPKR